YHDQQFFGFAVQKPLLEVGSLRVVVVPFEGLRPAHRRNEVVQAVPKASERRRPLQFSLQIRSHRTPPSLYVKSIRTTPISNPLLPAKERPQTPPTHPFPLWEFNWTGFLARLAGSKDCFFRDYI